MGRKAPVVNSVEVIGLWLSFPNYLARLWPLSKLGSRSQVPVFVLYNLWEKEPGDLVPPRIHVACPPSRGQEGSGRPIDGSQESSAVARRLPGPIARSRVLSSEFPRVLEAQT